MRGATQALYKLSEPSTIVRVREVDLPLLKDVLATAKEKYQKVSSSSETRAGIKIEARILRHESKILQWNPPGGLSWLRHCCFRYSCCCRSQSGNFEDSNFGKCVPCFLLSRSFVLLSCLLFSIKFVLFFALHCMALLCIPLMFFSRPYLFLLFWGSGRQVLANDSSQRVPHSLSGTIVILITPNVKGNFVRLHRLNPRILVFAAFTRRAAPRTPDPSLTAVKTKSPVTVYHSQNQPFACTNSKPYDRVSFSSSTFRV